MKETSFRMTGIQKFAAILIFLAGILAGHVGIPLGQHVYSTYLTVQLVPSRDIHPMNDCPTVEIEQIHIDNSVHQTPVEFTLSSKGTCPTKAVQLIFATGIDPGMRIGWTMDRFNTNLSVMNLSDRELTRSSSLTNHDFRSIDNMGNMVIYISGNNGQVNEITVTIMGIQDNRPIVPYEEVMD